MGWRQEWVPLSTTKFGWFVKIKSVNDEELESMWVDSRISCSRPCIEVTEWICTPSLLDISYLQQFDDRTLKSLIIMETVSFWLDIAFIKTSKWLRNFSGSPLDWLGERYKVAIKRFLFLWFNSKSKHSSKLLETYKNVQIRTL